MKLEYVVSVLKVINAATLLDLKKYFSGHLFEL